MTGPSGNSQFCFPSTSIFSSASPRGTLRVSGKQTSLFPLGPVIKCLKKMLSNSSQFLSSEQLSEPKNLDVALNIARVEKIRSENLRLWSIWRPFDSSFERKGAVVTVKICVLCVR